MKGKPAHDRDEREIPPPKADPGMRETDDHVMGQPRHGKTQAVDDLDLGVGDEHVRSPSQGVRPER
jgi:hypothetical protein